MISILKRIKFYAEEIYFPVLEFIDEHITCHRFYWMCKAVSFSSWGERHSTPAKVIDD